MLNFTEYPMSTATKKDFLKIKRSIMDLSMLKVMELPASRLSSLYKDFRPLKELNPEGYVANVSTWKEYLKTTLLNRTCILVSGTELLQKLSNPIYGIPKSLDVVIDALVQEDYLISSDDFFGRKMYSREYPKLMQLMGLGKNRFFKSRQCEDGYYLKKLKLIVRPNVENAFKRIAKRVDQRIISRATSVADMILSADDFFSKIGFCEIVDNHEDQSIQIFYMVHYKGTILFENSNFIKIVDPVNGRGNILTDEDLKIANLKLTISNISKQVGKMQTEKTEYSRILTQSITDGASRDTQRKLLQARKMVEKYLNRLLEYQNNLLEMKSQIEMSVTNGMLMKTLSNINEMLKSATRYSMSVDQLEDLLDEYKDYREQSDEIGNMLSGIGEIVNAEELDAELESLDRQVEHESTSEILDGLSHLKLNVKAIEEKNPSEMSDEKETKSKGLISEYD